jgi:hypothetical protein
MSLCGHGNAASVSSLRTASGLLVLCSCHSVQNAPIDICLSVCHVTTAYSRLRPSWRDSDLSSCFEVIDALWRPNICVRVIDVGGREREARMPLGSFKDSLWLVG